MPDAAPSHAAIKIFIRRFADAHGCGSEAFKQQCDRSLRRLLGTAAGLDPRLIAFARTEAGKPRIAAPDTSCRFSISHSGPWFAVAVADFEIGVDIETRTPRADPLLLARRFFHNADSHRLETASPLARAADFQRQWVAKEAALKAAGTGIAEHLHRVWCEFDGAAIKAVAGPSGRFAIHTFALEDGTPGAVAWQDGIAADVTLCKWPETAD